MIEKNHRITVAATPDRHLVWDRGESVRYIVVQLGVPAVDRSSGPTRLPLNLSMVIDASGSMAGENLEAAKSAVVGIADRLSDQDTLSIVSFADDVVTHLDGVPMSAPGRQLAKGSLQPLTTRGSTDLSSGWLKGAECVATVMERATGLHSRVIVLSDGHANRGILDLTEIGAHAEQLLSRGLATSTVGIGDGYAPDFLRVLAENGGGTMHDAEHAPEIVEVVLAELGDMRQLVAENLRVVLTCPSGAKAIALQPGDQTWSKVATAKFGAAIAKCTRVAVFRVKTPQGVAGDSMTFDIDVAWKIPGEAREETANAAVQLTWADGVQNTPQARDTGATQRAGEAWHAVVVHHASRLNRLGQRSEAQRHLDDELRFFRRYADGFEGLQELLSELEQLRAEAQRDWGERSRKEVEMLAYRRVQGKTESRSMARASSAASLIQPSPSTRHIPIVEYPLVCLEGHWFIDADGQRLFVDTGSPVSVGRRPSLSFGGRVASLHHEFAGEDIDGLVAMVGTPFDALLGMDILRRLCVVFDAGRGIARISMPGLHSSRSIPMTMVSGIPSVSITVHGVERRAFIDIGAKLSYVAGGIPGATEEGRDFYPGLGTFTTRIAKAKVEVGTSVLRLDIGGLPKLLETNLMVAGCDAILGAELLIDHIIDFDFPNLTMRVHARR